MAPDPDTIAAHGGLAPDPVAALRELEELGVSRVVIPPLSFDPDGIGAALEQFGQNVIAKASSSRTAQTIAESYEECVFRIFGASEAIRHD